MKWLITLIVVLALGAGGYFLAAHFTGGALPTFGLAIGGERQVIRQKALAFWEDVKFKDLANAASMLPSDKQDVAIIANFLTQIFGSAPDTLDLIGYDIVMAELDSTNRRARVKTSVMANNLATGKPLKRDVMLFFHKTNQGKWVLDLSNSF